MAEKKADAQVKSIQFQLAVWGELDGAQALQLNGADERRQILVNAQLDDGGVRDVTRDVSFSVSPKGVVHISKNGRVIPEGDGKAILVATLDGMKAILPVEVSGFGEVKSVNFPNQIVPIFTKLGCNGVGRHGKSGGQN